MDFGALLHTAQKNGKGGKKEAVRYYSTKFEPPKKEQRNKQQLSENIKKFLAKKEAEEQEKKLEAQRKRDELLALRAKDKKATRRVNVMLKRTKSANQSVLQDAVDANNTSVTLAGPIQPDEDDYGYVSQEAAAFYNKMMEKYSKIPDEPKFNLNKKKVSTDLNSTKERVKAAINRERDEANLPHRRKRKLKSGEEEELPKQENTAPQKKAKPPPPPPLNFNELLKLAEKKQFEPIIIEQKPKEEEKLLTKKQKKEMEREKEWRDRKEGKLPPLENKIPKVEKTPKIPVKKPEIVKAPEVKKIEKIPEKKVPLPNIQPGSSANKQRELNEIKKKEIKLKPKQFPPPDLKPRKEFKPPEVVRRKELTMKEKKMNKRRILDDDYDSEMDDFIDDGPEDGSEDYSKYISEIFGYDKSKYRYADEDVDNMESSFAQQMREEVISTKIGIMEDLEDMKKEEEEKRRKASLKKKQKY